MWHIQWVPLGYGLLMATIDVFMLGLIRLISDDVPKLIRYMIVPTIVYAIQPWIFLDSLKYESLIVMNLTWDLISDILVTMLGLFYFGETIGFYKKLGVVLSFISIILLSSADGFEF
jgi:multidrug transporter EmrE-like cation transporter